MTERMNISPTLIIGLGGTGSLALQYTKRKIRDRLRAIKGSELPRQIPFVEYLVLDTMVPEERLEELVPDEFFDMGRLNISRVLSNLAFESDDKILKWFPRHLDPGQIDSGAGGVRAIGRLCFFLSVWRIEESLRNKVKQITNSANIKSFLGEHLSSLKMDEASAIDVHIVTSLCGGTGSACLLDISYLVKHIIADDTKQMPNSTAHLVTPEPFEGEPGIGRSSREYIQQNFAVALSEIEHFTKKDAPRPWDVEYRNGTRVHSVEKPFSVAYLLGYKEGVSLGKRQLCEIIGETIAIKTVHPDGKRIKGIIENYKPHVINTEDARQKRRTYSSYNTQILKIDMDESMLRAATEFAAKTILSTLCDEVSFETAEHAVLDFEESVLAQETKLSKLDFDTFQQHLRNQVDIQPDKFREASFAIRKALSLSDRKRKKVSHEQTSRVNTACEGPESEINANRERFIINLRTYFLNLERKTDERINGLLSDHGLPHVHLLLKTLSKKLNAFQGELSDYRESLPSLEHNYDQDLIGAIQTGSGQSIPTICSDRAKAKTYGSILEALSRHMAEYERKIKDRTAWCYTARKCLIEADNLLIESNRIAKPSHTTSSVWTEAAIRKLIREKKARFVRKFITLLERHYYSGDLNQRVCFLPHLNDSPEATQTSLRLVREAASAALKEEIEPTDDVMRKEALKSIHEFIELASPAWQIEKGGEDIASASITNCPEDSESGEIMTRSGKNITFSQNGANPRELILFRSEHGASVNQLINFRRCLNAVTRKMHLEGKGRINDLCLDPEWNIAAPLPLEIEELRLDFSLAIHFQLIKPGFEAYTFRNASNTTIELRQSFNKKKATRRFEAFSKLLDLDCAGGEDCNYLRKAVAEKRSQNTQDQNILSFRRQLLTHQENLRQLLSDEKDIRERMQVLKEIENLNIFLEELDISIAAIET